MFDVSRLFIIFKISYLFSFFIITKGLQEERAGKYTLNVCFKLKQCTKGSDNFLYAPWQSTTDVKTIKIATRFTQVSILLQFQAPVCQPLRFFVVLSKSHDITKLLKLFRNMQMHNKMGGCFVTAPTTPWAGKELWYKQCGRAKEVLAGRAPHRDSFLQYQVTGTICLPGLRVT